MLGGTDASVTVAKRVELSTRCVEGATRLAVLAESAEAAAVALVALDGLEIADDDQALVLAAYRRALGATRDRWPALERDAPRSDRRGHTIDPVTGGLHPTHSPPRAESTSSACDWVSDPGCDLPCELIEVISIADAGCF